MKSPTDILFILLLLIPMPAATQPYYRIMFYNVENLFDTQDNPQNNDQDFLPNSPRSWTASRYNKKINEIAKVIIAIGRWQPPELIGLCEVENRQVLLDLSQKSPLKKADYGIIHRDSPDERGIDVALLYRKERFTPIDYQHIEVHFPFNPDDRTRDLLYVHGHTPDNDSLHLFICHWPSQRGGRKASQPKRQHVAQIIRRQIDSLQQTYRHPAIIIMGDLNTFPQARPLIHDLKATDHLPEAYLPDSLYNLSTACFKRHKTGTHKYSGHWQMLDQIIVSGSLLNQQQALYTSPEDMHIFAPPFLLEADKRYMGYQPKRCYRGPAYHGGFSDHLPVFLNFSRK